MLFVTNCCFRWSDDQIELLITSVQSKPSLYDLKNRHYKDNRFANSAWQIISTEIGKSRKYIN